MRAGWIRIAVVIGGVLAAQADAWAVRLTSVRLEREAVERYRHVEVNVQIDGVVDNPFDPDQINLEAVFDTPGGPPVTVPGFYYEPFERVRNNAQDVIRPAGTPYWKVRFTPRKTGVWTVAVRLTTPAGTQTAPRKTFEVVESADRGFVRLDRDRGAFHFDRGDEPFIPIGENVAWATGAQPLASYDQWLHDLAKQRANYLRVWLAPWGFRLETKDTHVGRYDQQRAWQLDAVLEQSEKLGLYWQLSLLDHGAFSRVHDPDWANNPYNEQVGGMCRLPNDFATDPRARAMFRRMLRYLVARYGYSTQLVMWELFNEIDLSEIAMADAQPWIAEMSQALRELDPNGRPVTISFHHEEPEAVWRLPTIDVIQLHLYDRRDVAELFTGPQIDRLRQRYGKPVMVGEFGWINEFVRQFDDRGIHFHDGLWAGLMGGAMGSPMMWYWDTYVHPNGLFTHFKPLAEFWRGEQLGKAVKPIPVSCSDRDALCAALGNPQRVFLWLKNRTHNVDRYLAYRAELAKQRIREERGEAKRAIAYPPRTIAGASMTVPGLDLLGNYRVEWWDTYTGQVTQRIVAPVRGGTLTLAVPDVRYDLAAKLIKLHWWERN